MFNMAKAYWFKQLMSQNFGAIRSELREPSSM